MNHFHFKSQEFRQTLVFYTRYFGFKEIRCLGKTHVLQNSKGFVLAVDESEVTEGLSPGAHLGFTLKTEREVVSLFEELTKESFQVKRLERPSPKAIHFYCSDPSGNTVEVGWFDFSESKRVATNLL